MSTGSPPEPPNFTRWRLASLALPTGLASLGVSIANVSLPTLGNAFSASFQEVQWVVIAYLLAVTTMIVSAGRLGDVFGPRRVLLAGVMVFTLASGLCALAQSLPMLILARAGQGFGAAILTALALAMVRETMPAERTGRAMGVLGTLSAIGTALGPSLGGSLISIGGWRAIFVLMVPLGIASFLLGLFCLPADRDRQANPRKEGLDVPGMFFLGVALAAYSLAMTVDGSLFAPATLGLIAATLVSAGLFLLVEQRTEAPLLRLAALRDRALSAGLIANILVASVLMATLVVGPFYLIRVLGLSEAIAGAVLSFGPAMSIVSGIPAGRIVDRFGARPVMLTGLSGIAIGSFALAILPQHLGLGGYLLAIAILTPGYQMFQAANNTAVMMGASATERGAISGLLGLSRNLGLLSGTALMGAIFACSSGFRTVATASADALARGFTVTFLVAGGLALLALGILAGGTRTTR